MSQAILKESLRIGILGKLVTFENKNLPYPRILTLYWGRGWSCALIWWEILYKVIFDDSFQKDQIIFQYV